jgi:hypothetical protein
VAVLALLLLALLAAGCGAEPEAPEAAAAPGLTTYTDERLGYEVTFPSGWQRAREVLTPALGDPWEILSLGTVEPVPNDDGSACAQIPVATLEGMGRRDVFLTIQERTNATSSEMVDALPQLSAVEPDTSEAGACLGHPVPFSTYWMPFRHGARGFYALAAVGDDADLQPLQRVLDSLRFHDRRLEDDRQRGLKFSYPTGWHIFPFQLHEVTELRHQEALGTFPLEQAEPDPNCLPKTALAAMGPDDGLLFITEVVPRSDAVPLRRGRFQLAEREPQPYECYGVSHRLAWREWHGRTFTAHLYGPPQRVEQALGILDTLEVAEQYE